MSTDICGLFYSSSTGEIYFTFCKILFTQLLFYRNSQEYELLIFAVPFFSA